MTCLSCGAEKTIEAHLIPKAFAMEVKRHRGEQHLIIHQGIERPKVSNTGAFDRTILCGPCDGILGKYESYVFKLLKRLREVKAPFGTIVPVDLIEGDTIVRFAAGIAWKFAVTTLDRGQIKLGPYTEILGDIALRGAPIPPAVDVALIRIVELDGDVYYYREPLYDRKDDANMVRFSVGGFVVFLKIDKRRNGQTLPATCWLRGRSAGAFLMAPRPSLRGGENPCPPCQSPTHAGFLCEDDGAFRSLRLTISRRRDRQMPPKWMVSTAIGTTYTSAIHAVP